MGEKLTAFPVPLARYVEIDDGRALGLCLHIKHLHGNFLMACDNVSMSHCFVGWEIFGSINYSWLVTLLMIDEN